jgi:hypothetical protein
MEMKTGFQRLQHALRIPALKILHQGLRTIPATHRVWPCCSCCVTRHPYETLLCCKRSLCAQMLRKFILLLNHSSTPSTVLSLEMEHGRKGSWQNYILECKRVCCSPALHSCVLSVCPASQTVGGTSDVSVRFDIAQH